MATEQEARIESLERELRRRDKEEAEAKATALAAQHATQDAIATAAQVEAALASKEQVRRGAWVSELISTAPKDAPVDFGALKIPDGWPSNAPESSFSFGPGIVPQAAQIDVSDTFMGRALASRKPIGGNHG